MYSQSFSLKLIRMTLILATWNLQLATAKVAIDAFVLLTNGFYSLGGNSTHI